MIADVAVFETVVSPLMDLFPSLEMLVFDDSGDRVLTWWYHDGTAVRPGDVPAPAAVVSLCRAELARAAVAPSDEPAGSGVAIAQIPWGSGTATLAMASPERTMTDVERSGFRLFCEVATRRVDIEDAAAIGRSRLDDLVTEVATGLTGVSIADLQDTLDRTLELVGRFLRIDTCFLRRNDFEARVSRLVSEWPRRENLPDPDPLGVVPFDTDDPVFASIEQLASPLVITPSSSKEDRYQERVHDATGLPEVSLAMVPLRPGTVTEGVLGFIHFGDRAWPEDEVSALRVIAGLLAQVLARVDAEEQLHTLAYRDVLTGLPNRREFLEELERRLDRTVEHPFTLAILDLDRLKTMNDIFGHAAGDDLIRASARRLAAACGEHDMVARLGGDEFVLILDGIDSPESARRAAMSILTDLRVPLTIGNVPVHRSASIGAAVSGHGPRSIDDLMRSADMALLEAKSRGGDEAVIFNEVLEHRTRRRDDLELRLGGAIEAEEFELYYQPEFDLESREITGVEALVRWNHPFRGVLTAAEFIPVAEETNRSRRLGRWILQQACRQRALWSDVLADRPFNVRVNTSPGDFLAADFLDELVAQLSLNGLQAADLCLEITESSVIRDLPVVVARLHALRALGVELAIDDFGTGHSSLAQLKSLPVDTLKIDRSFVISIERDRSDRAIVAGIVGLANSFGLETVVEGVETEEAAGILLGLGCRRAQGWLVSPAMPADKVTAMLLGGMPTAGASRSMTDLLPQQRDADLDDVSRVVDGRRG